MRLIHQALRRRRSGLLTALFFSKDDASKGRRSMFLSAVISYTLTFFTSGIFYTGFLSGNDIDIVNVGIISFIPYIAGSFAVFSPFILERVARRRWLLAGMRALHYTLNIFATTLMPVFVKDPHARMICFCVLVFSAHFVNALFLSGYSAWHVNFIPDEIRADYLSVSQIGSALLSAVFIVGSSVLTDALAGSAYQLTVITAIRYGAYALALLDVVVLCLPKEYPYIKKATVKLRNVFVLPFKNRKFILTMVIAFSWSFVSCMTLSSVDYFLLNDIGVKYTFINVINAAYALFLLLFSPMWKRFIARHGWIFTFAVTVLAYVPTTVLYAFTTPGNYTPVVLTVRLLQHFFGVGLNLAFANLLYLNLPEADRTNYTSFNLMGSNLVSLFGMAAGVLFVSLTKGASVTVFGFTFQSVPMLLLLQAAGQMIVFAIALALNKKASPERQY